jgi:hypothetical protein
MSTNTKPETDDSIDLDQFSENRQAAMLMLQAVKKLGLHPPVNEPILREATPAGDDYLIIIPLGPAIGEGGAKIACMVFDVKENPDRPITFEIDDREAETWVEGYHADEINSWVHPDTDADYETYPVEKIGEKRFEVVESTPFYDSYDHEHAEELYSTPDTDDTAPGVMSPPDTDLSPTDDPGFY